jgi:hypothetical protein
MACIDFMDGHRLKKEIVKVWPPQFNLDKSPKIGPGANYNDVCPKCKGHYLVKRGLDKGLQRYECKFCLYKFRYNGQ